MVQSIAMASAVRLTLKLASRATHRYYNWREHRLATLPPGGRPLVIAFTEREPWEVRVRQGFEGLPHQVHFLDLQAADLERFDLIVPLSIDDAQFLRRQPAHVRVRMLPLPDEGCALLCHDKPRLNRTLIQAGFREHVPPMGEDIPPPYVCKPDSGENSEFCVLVPDGATEQRLADSLRKPGLFRQAAVWGRTEYASHFIMRDGRLVRELSVKYHHDTPLFIKHQGTDGSVSTLGHCPDPRTLEAMLRAIGYDGVGCANFKLDPRGQLQLIEINPRMGGSLCPYFFSFLRSMPGVWRSKARGCTNWTWLDSTSDDERLGRA